MGWRDRKPYVEKGAREWQQPKSGKMLTTAEVVKLYEKGCTATKWEPEQREELFSSVDYPDGEQACYDFGLVESGKGKLSLLFTYAMEAWPNIWPKPGQETGDCVSRAGANIATVLIPLEVAIAKADEHTGIIEGLPEIPELGIRNGAVVCETLYGDRGHRGQGASCERLINHLTKTGGILLRKDYPELGYDFTKLNTRLGMNWGGSGTPSNLKAEGQKHQVRTATDVPNHEVARDMIANGYPIWACSGLGWSSKRDENGYSRQQGGWNHSWIVAGYDDRPEIYDIYGFPLFLYIHDWWKWNSGGRRVYGTNVDIPEGCFWGDARLLNRCSLSALSSTNGWAARNLPDYKTGVL